MDEQRPPATAWHACVRLTRRGSWASTTYTPQVSQQRRVQQRAALRPCRICCMHLQCGPGVLRGSHTGCHFFLEPEKPKRHLCWEAAQARRTLMCSPTGWWGRWHRH